MGLNSTWNDSAQANEYVPPLDKPWAYGTMPIRGVNLGGWLSVEPFITPSFFNSYKPNQGVVDEYTLCAELGPSKAAKLLEKHYARFVTEQTFREIQAAGLDHIRIPFSYWAITTYPGDPYVPKISWRYLLRAIEYARKYGLRVNLDVHGLPGSQNGWNHSGRLGAIGWLNGTDGALNAQRSLDLHAQLSAFFAQPRYRNIIVIYGLVNEPKMSSLNIEDVVTWTESAVRVVRENGIKQMIAFGDGFLGLLQWKGKFQGLNGLVLDAHQYTIFNPNEIVFSHQKKIEYACTGWSELFEKSMDPSTG
jgi:glucan 1,3-beta-glucosidase